MCQSPQITCYLVTQALSLGFRGLDEYVKKYTNGKLYLAAHAATDTAQENVEDMLILAINGKREYVNTGNRAGEISAKSVVNSLIDALAANDHRTIARKIASEWRRPLLEKKALEKNLKAQKVLKKSKEEIDEEQLKCIIPLKNTAFFEHDYDSILDEIDRERAAGREIARQYQMLKDGEIGFDKDGRGFLC